MKTAILLIAALALSTEATASKHRNSQTRAEFQKANPCPATGKTTGACPGYVKDHVKPLACGGPDKPSNLQWQTVEDAKAKDKWERKECGK